MDVDLLGVTFPGAESLLSGGGNLMEVSCTCKPFSLGIDCENVKSSTGNLRSEMRFMAISSIKVRSTENGSIPK